MLSKGGTIIEATSGNTGIGIASIVHKIFRFAIELHLIKQKQDAETYKWFSVLSVYRI